MATKISELTTASTLDGSELIPVVQGGVTKQTTMNDIAASSAVAFSIKTTGNQAVTAGASTIVEFDTVEFDDNSLFNLSTNKFQPSIAGKYTIMFRVTIDPTGTATGMGVEIVKNGVAEAYTTNDASSSGFVYLETSTILDMNGSTDYVEFKGRVDGTAGTIMGNEPYRTEVVGHLIGGVGTSGDSDWQTPAFNSMWEEHEDIN